MAWIGAQGFTTKDQREATHLLMTGGKIRIPADREPEFLERYAADLEAGRDLFFVEKRTPVFRFFADLDFLDDRPYSPDDVEPYVACIQRALRDIFGGATDLQAILCTAPPKEHVLEGRAHTKSGAHLVWPNLFVDQATALKVRAGLVHAIVRDLGERDRPHNSVREVLDACVYIGNGLRMIGSDKFSPCGTCKNRPEAKAGCAGCGGLGRYAERRPYRVERVYGADGSRDPAELAELQASALRRVVRTNLRAWAEATPASWPVWFGAVDASQFGARGAGKKGGGGRPAKPRGRPRNAEAAAAAADAPPPDSDFEPVDPNSTVAASVAAFVRRAFPFRPEVTEVRAAGEGRKRVYYVRTTSRYCENLRKRPPEHNSNGVYFVITVGGATQRCFCKCDTTEGRVSGRCAEFKSRVRPLDGRIYSILFPGAGPPPPKKVKKEAAGAGGPGAPPRAPSDRNEAILARVDKILGQIAP